MENFTHGLIVVDPNESGDEKTILHFVGYPKEPNQRDVALLRIELRDDETFGLQDMWDKVDILPAPEDVVQEYLDIVNSGEATEL